MHRKCRSPSLGGKNGTEMPRRGRILQSPGLERNALPTVGAACRDPYNRLSQFLTHAWLLCFGVLVRQSNVDVTNLISKEVSSTHVCDGNQKRVFNSSKKRLPGTQHRVAVAEFPAEVLPRRSVRPLCGAPPYTPNASGNVGLRRYLCWYPPT